MINVVELDERIEKCLSILHENPRSRIFAALADAYRRRGEVGRAFSVCKNGLRIHPKYGAAHIVMARLYLHQNMVEQARQSVEAAVAAEGRSRATDLLLAEIHLESGERAPAREILDRLAADGGKDPAWTALHNRLQEAAERVTLPRKRSAAGPPTPTAERNVEQSAAGAATLNYCASPGEFIERMKTIPRLLASAVREGSGDAAVTTCSQPEQTRVVAEEMFALFAEIDEQLSAKGWGTLATLRVENAENQWGLTAWRDSVAMCMGTPRLGYAAAMRHLGACLEQLVERDNLEMSESPSRSVTTDQTAE